MGMVLPLTEERMRHILRALLAIFAGVLSMAAQNPMAPEQSARQALIEMFEGKGENDFTRHLPDAARAALLHKGETPETSLLFRASGAVRGLAAQGDNVETFDTGPNILVSENTNSHERVEIAVERDSFSGEEDEIELSVHPYKNGEPEVLPVIPSLIFTLKKEKDIWRVTELSLTAHVPLEDPDYLKGLRKQQDELNESAVQMRINMIAQMETNYAANHPDTGYVCTLGTLYPNAEGEPNAFASLSKDESSGYRISLTGCSGKPGAKYRLTAIPIDADSEMKAFCLDQSGTLKSVAAADSATCFSEGKILTGAAVSLTP
jgi:hypothetical protein